MKITKVSYLKTFPIAMYCNEKIGVDVEVLEGEDAELALKTAKQLVEEFHLKNNPQLFGNTELLPEKEPIKTVKKTEPKTYEEKIIRDMNTCTEENVLKTYDLLTRNFPKAREAYEIKLKELTNGTK